MEPAALVPEPASAPAAEEPPRWPPFDSEELSRRPFPERVSALKEAWREVAENTEIAEEPRRKEGLKALYRTTLLFFLQEEWQKCDPEKNSPLKAVIEKCAEKEKFARGEGEAEVASVSEATSALAKRARTLRSVAEDPWYHPALKKTIRGEIAPREEFLSWIREEGFAGACERLRRLGSAGGSGCRAALAFAESILSFSAVPISLRKFALDARLVLLAKAGRTGECVTHIESLDAKEATAIVGRLAGRDRRDGRLWKRARETALLCAQVLVAASLIRPLEGDRFKILAAQLTSLYSERPAELPPVLRKLLRSAETADHIYVLCRAVQNAFGDVMQQFVCELYIRSLTTGINELERLKLQDERSESALDASHRLASWFLALGEYLSADPRVAAECVLTAFSLHPSKYYYKKLEESSAIARGANSKTDARENSDGNLPSGFPSDVEKIDGRDAKDPKSNERNPGDVPITPDLISAAVLESENLSIGSDMCYDLAVLLSGPRLKLLTWDLPWYELSQNCLSYMADTDEGTKTLTKELKFVHLDYTQWTPKNEEERDIYYGIEKGYEHHLEIEDDDDWEDDPNDSPYYSDDYSKKSSKKQSSKPLPNYLDKHKLPPKPESKISQNADKPSVNNYNCIKNTMQQGKPVKLETSHDRLVFGNIQRNQYLYNMSSSLATNKVSVGSGNDINKTDKILVCQKQINVQKPLHAYKSNIGCEINKVYPTPMYGRNPSLYVGQREINCNVAFSNFENRQHSQNTTSNESFNSVRKPNQNVYSMNNSTIKTSKSNTANVNHQRLPHLTKLLMEGVVDQQNFLTVKDGSKCYGVNPMKSLPSSKDHSHMKIHQPPISIDSTKKPTYHCTNIPINNPRGVPVDFSKPPPNVNKTTWEKNNIIRNRILNHQMKKNSLHQIEKDHIPPQHNSTLNSRVNTMIGPDKKQLSSDRVPMLRIPVIQSPVPGNAPNNTLERFITELQASVNAGSAITSNYKSTSNETKAPSLSYPKSNYANAMPVAQNQNRGVSKSVSSHNMSANERNRGTPQTYSRKCYSNNIKDFPITNVQKPIHIEKRDCLNASITNKATQSMSYDQSFFEDIEQFGIKAHKIKITKPLAEPSTSTANTSGLSNDVNSYSMLSGNKINTDANLNFQRDFKVSALPKHTIGQHTSSYNHSIANSTPYQQNVTSAYSSANESIFNLNGNHYDRTVHLKNNDENLKAESISKPKNDPSAVYDFTEDSVTQRNTFDHKNTSSNSSKLKNYSTSSFFPNNCGDANNEMTNLVNVCNEPARNTQENSTKKTSIMDHHKAVYDNSVRIPEPSTSNISEALVINNFGTNSFIGNLEIVPLNNDEKSNLKFSQYHNMNVITVNSAISNSTDTTTKKDNDAKSIQNIIIEDFDDTNLKSTLDKLIESSMTTNVSDITTDSNQDKKIVYEWSNIFDDACEPSLEQYLCAIIENQTIDTSIDEITKSLVECQNIFKDTESDAKIDLSNPQNLNVPSAVEEFSNQKGDIEIRIMNIVEEPLELKFNSNQNSVTQLSRTEDKSVTIDENIEIKNPHIESGHSSQQINSELVEIEKEFSSGENYESKQINEVQNVLESNLMIDENLTVEPLVSGDENIDLHIPESEKPQLAENKSTDHQNSDDVAKVEHVLNSNESTIEKLSDLKDKTSTDDPENKELTVVNIQKQTEPAESENIPLSHENSLNEIPDVSPMPIEIPFTDSNQNKICDTIETIKTESKPACVDDKPITVGNEEILTPKLIKQNEVIKPPPTSDIIDLVSDNSDDDIIEVPLQDPIAITSVDVENISDFTRIKTSSKSRKRNSLANIKKSLMIVVDDPISNKIIKVNSIDFRHQLKLQMVCRVKLHDIHVDNCEKIKSLKRTYKSAFMKKPIIKNTCDSKLKNKPVLPNKRTEQEKCPTSNIKCEKNKRRFDNTTMRSSKPNTRSAASIAFQRELNPRKSSCSAKQKIKQIINKNKGRLSIARLQQKLNNRKNSQALVGPEKIKDKENETDAIVLGKTQNPKCFDRDEERSLPDKQELSSSPEMISELLKMSDNPQSPIYVVNSSKRKYENKKIVKKLQTNPNGTNVHQEISKNQCTEIDADLPSITTVTEVFEFPLDQSILSVKEILHKGDSETPICSNSNHYAYEDETKYDWNSNDELSLSNKDEVIDNFELFQTDFPHLNHNYIKDFDKESDREKTKQIGNCTQLLAASLSDYIEVRLPVENEKCTSENNLSEKSFEKMHLVSMIQAEIDNLLNNNAVGNDDKRSVLKELENLKDDAKLKSENIKSCPQNVADILNQVKKVCKRFQKDHPSYFNIFSHIPGVEDSEHFYPPPSFPIVQVIQVEQIPVNSSQPHTAAAPTPSSEYSDTTTTNNSDDSNSPNRDSKIENTDDDNKDISDKMSDISKNANQNIKKPSDVDQSIIIGNEEQSSNTVNSTVNNERIQSPNSSSEGSSVQLIFAPQASSRIDLTNMDSGNDSSVEPSENSIHLSSTSNPTSISGNRAQTLVNILSQKIIHPPTSLSNQPIQMTAFSKGTPINALSLQQALAQILPPPLSQASSDSGSVSQTSQPQVVHIVQGKSTNQTGSFSGLLVENPQSSIMGSGNQTTQVLHIVQSKSNNPNQSITGQTNLNNFGGLSIVESGSQQAANQLLHIVNTQNKNNATAQLLKRVNLLTSLSNPQGNNEQKMVQFVCKSADGKTIQLNTQPQRSMVLRLQPIDNTNNAQPKTNEVANPPAVSIQNSVKKSPQNDQAQQEIKSRSVYEENYAKFIQNSSNKLSPLSPDKSTSLPKFNQAFGKTVFQENATISKPMETSESSQMTNANTEPQSSQEINLNQINNSPLLIRKTPTSNQNIQQIKQNLTPMNIQTMHGGVIYTRQIPVNIGGNQTINLITVPSSDLLEESHIQNIGKQSQDNKIIINEQSTEQIIKIIPQEGTLSEANSEEVSNQQFSDQNTSNLLTPMRIKVPMLGKSSGQMVTGTRVVRPVLQIQRNIPGTNSAVYQQLVLTTAPAIRQLNPGIQSNIKPGQSTTNQQENNLSTSTLEQLREFDMVLEQVKERSTVQPGGNTFTESSQNESTSESPTPNSCNNNDSNLQAPNQREILYSIGPNQRVNVTYVNQKILTNTPTVLATSYVPNAENSNVSQNNTGSLQITHNHSESSKSGSSTPNKIVNKPLKSKPTKPQTIPPTVPTKTNPILPKTSLQKPLEDEQTTQRILYILAEYKEQVENSPDKDKPAPRRRSNPPTNPSSSSKRKKGSSNTSKKIGSQSVQEMSPLGAEESGHTMGSEDSSCGLSQGECGENSTQGLENQSPQGSPQKTARKLLFTNSDVDAAVTTSQPQQRNVIIADGQTITMTRPGANKTTALLMPANYILPMSMMKGGQQIAIVTNQGPKILSVPHGEGNTTNTLFLQRLVSPTGLKPMLARPNQVRQVRLPASAIQAFGLTPTANVSNDNTWTSADENAQSKLSTDYQSQNIKEAEKSDSSEKFIKEEMESSRIPSESNLNILTNEKHPPNNSTGQNIADVTQHSAILKEVNSSTMNLIQLHSLGSDDPSKIFAVQNSAALNSLIQITGKNNIHGLSTLNLQDGRKIQEVTDNVVLIRKPQFDEQFTIQEGGISDEEMKTIPELELQNEENVLKASPSSSRGFTLTHSGQIRESPNQEQPTNNGPWSTNHTAAVSPSYGSYSNSPRLTHQGENQDSEISEVIINQKSRGDDNNRILQHQYSPVSSPGPRHLYNKIFISSSSANTTALESKELTQTRENLAAHTETDLASIRVGVSGSHSTASLRHKFAIMEHELRLQKSLSEECEDLGVDSPSASDLFPEAELLFAASPTSQFEHSQDGTNINPNQILNSSLSQNNQLSNTILFSHMPKENRSSEEQATDMVEESEFARMHPNTTFHSGEIEFISDSADDSSINIPFRISKQSANQHVNIKKNEIIKSVIEGAGTSGSPRSFSGTKLISHFPTLNANIKKNINMASTLQSSDDNSESAEESINLTKDKNDKTKKSLTSMKKKMNPVNTLSDALNIQQNITQVIRHSSVAGPASPNKKLIKKQGASTASQNGEKILENHPQNVNAKLLKSVTLEKDHQEILTCSSPEQHSELFWESNSNSNQSAESIPNPVTGMIDFSSEDSNKCCKSPVSCDETNSTDSSIELQSIQMNKDHNSRVNSVIKSSSGISGAADGPILHSALTSNLPNLINHDISRKRIPNLAHISDSNISTSPESDILQDHKQTLNCRVLSPRSLTSEVNLGIDIETSSSEETNTGGKGLLGNQLRSGSSSPEGGAGSGRIRRTSLRGVGGVKKSCHCCSGVDAPNTSTQSNNQNARRPRRKLPTTAH